MLVTTTHLHQLDPSELNPARTPRQPAAIVGVEESSPEFVRFLYTAVGRHWHWTDRLPWALTQWTEWLTRSGSETWVSWINGTPAGYVELAAQSHGDATRVEIAYFGLLPRFIGRGLGGQLLTEGIRNAWTLHQRFPELSPVTRVWVHTCTLDGPHALRNYTSRGFQISRPLRMTCLSPRHPPGPSPEPTRAEWHGLRSCREAAHPLSKAESACGTMLLLPGEFHDRRSAGADQAWTGFDAG